MKNYTKNTCLKLVLMLCACFAAGHICNLLLKTRYRKIQAHRQGIAKKVKRILESSEENGEYLITWTLNLHGGEYLLNSPHLASAFEQIVKDYINNDIKCAEDTNDSTNRNTAFYSVKFATSKIAKFAVAGTGKCIGRRKNCFRFIRQTKPQETKPTSINKTNLNTTKSKNESCEIFQNQSIFESFQSILDTVLTFSYNVDVEYAEDQLGNIEIIYNVSFVPSTAGSFNLLEQIDLNPEKDIEVSKTCIESECLNQEDTIIDIFNHFGIPVVENQHECAYEGINCDEDDKVTFIWIGKCYTILFHLQYVKKDF